MATSPAVEQYSDYNDRPSISGWHINEWVLAKAAELMVLYPDPGLLMTTSIVTIMGWTFLYAIQARVWYSKSVRHWFQPKSNRPTWFHYERTQMFAGLLYSFVTGLAVITAPVFLWINFKSNTWASARKLAEIRSIINWFNYFLGIVYFTHTFLKYLSYSLDVPLTPLLEPQTADLMLGIMAAMTGFMDLGENAAASHGWGTACTFAELGYTLRLINRENPELFPPGSTQQLFCTESVLTFEQVYKATTETKWDDLEDAVLHNGNTCILECSLKQPDGEKESISYPISCAIEGLAASRWTLSAERDRQRYRLCPKPRNATQRNATNGTLASSH